MGTSPKVKASTGAALLATVVVTFLMTLVPGLKDQDAIVKAVADLVLSGISALFVYGAGWYKLAVGWADGYVRAHGGNLP